MNPVSPSLAGGTDGDDIAESRSNRYAATKTTERRENIKQAETAI